MMCLVHCECEINCCAKLVRCESFEEVTCIRVYKTKRTERGGDGRNEPFRSFESIEPLRKMIHCFEALEIIDMYRCRIRPFPARMRMRWNGQLLL